MSQRPSRRRGGAENPELMWVEILLEGLFSLAANACVLAFQCVVGLIRLACGGYNDGEDT